MQVVVPMSGAGKRFTEAGYQKVKPLLLVDGRPMVSHVVEMFSPDDEFVFLCNAEHLADSSLGMERTLRELAPHVLVVPCTPPTLGPNHAILQAKNLLGGGPVFVSYCDFSMDWDREDFLTKVRGGQFGSASICYRGFHPHLLHRNLYAGVRADGENNALEVREKFSFTANSMDTWQQSGVFYFSSGNVLSRYVERSIAEGWSLNGEFYTSLLFTPMIRDGIRSLVYPAQHFCQWGTPDDLEEYEAWSRLFLGTGSGGKGVTEIPPSRESHVRIPYAKDSDEYRLSERYWHDYFSKKAATSKKKSTDTPALW